MKKIVILGGGYGGLRITQKLLSKKLPEEYEIVLIDRNPYHTFKTEFHALAAGTVSEIQIRHDFPEHEKLKKHYGEIKSIDLTGKKVTVDEEEITYDYLVVGLGCEDKYHGVPGAEEYTQSVQTICKARKTFETLNGLLPYKKVAIVGGGLTGIELAAELRESRKDIDITIFDHGKSILSMFDEKIQGYATKWFEVHNVKIVNEARVSKVEEGFLYNGEEKLEFDAVVWSAGVQPNKLVRELEVEKDKQGKIILNEWHQINEFPEVYVVGDCASLPHPPSAQLAEQQGEQIASVLHSVISGKKPRKLSQIKVKGSLGSLGKKDGFGAISVLSLTGIAPRFVKTGVLWIHHIRQI